MIIPMYLMSSSCPTLPVPGCPGSCAEMKVVLLYLHRCCFCDWACNVIEPLEFTVVIELVGLSLFRHDSMCSNYISDCCVDITFVGSAVIICKDFSSEWCAHRHFLSLKMDPFLHLPSWASPACSAQHWLSALHFYPFARQQQNFSEAWW